MSFPSPVPTSQEVNFLDKPLFCKGQEDWGISGIRSLAIVNCGLSPSIYPQLAAVLRASPGLEELNLARNGIGLEVERLIPLILELGLKKLSLASTGLNTKGAIALVPGFAALTLLDLSNNGLEDEFIETLVENWPIGLKTLSLAYNHLTDISKNLLQPSISVLGSLDLSHNPMPISTPFPFLPVLKLRGLSVTSSLDCEELIIGWGNLYANFPERLKSLDCPAGRLFPIAISSIRLCTYLQSVNLTGCGLREAAGEVAGLRNLRDVRLGTNGMDAGCVRRVLEGLSRCGELQVLDLSDNPASNWDIGALLPVSTLQMLILASIALPDGLPTLLCAQKSLFSLNLSRSGLNSSKLPEIITSLREIPLAELCLSGNNLSQPLPNVPKMAFLQRLEVANCCINATSLEAISAFLPASLTHFDLFNNPIGPCSFPILPALVSLNLHKCQMRNFGIERLCPGLSLCPDLKELKLGWNCLTAACVPLLADVLPAGLHHLSLFENLLDDERALHLVNSLPSALQILDLGYTHLTTEVVKTLLERLPALVHLQLCNLVGQTLSPEVLSAVPKWPLVLVNQ